VKNSPCDDLSRGKIAFAVRDALRETDPAVTDERVRVLVNKHLLAHCPFDSVEEMLRAIAAYRGRERRAG
jgi:hypothetical protein